MVVVGGETAARRATHRSGIQQRISFGALEHGKSSRFSEISEGWRRESEEAFALARDVPAARQ